MPRKLSSIAPDWWDYTTLDDEIIHDAAALTPEKMARLSRPGFKVVMYDTLEDFYLAEALEYLVDLRVSIFCRGDAMARDMRESRSVRCSNDSLRRTADLRVERFRSAAQLREPFLGLYLG